MLGRGSEASQTPDLDLDPYGALEKGISQRHALLRPTGHNLYLLDLNSANGT